MFSRILPPAVLLIAASVPLAAQVKPIDDPIPERIPKGGITVELQPVAQGLVSPVLLVAVPGETQRLLVVDQVGLVRVIDAGTLAAEPWLDVSGRLATLKKQFDERGLLGLAFDPDYKTAGRPGHRRVFTYTSEPLAGRTDFPIVHGTTPADHQSVLASWKVAADGRRVDPASRRELLRIDQPQFNHNGGMIEFGPDGFLYIGMGDGGSALDVGPGHNPETGNGQDRNVLLGKMLRIDVNGTDSANKNYGIPKDNPFAQGGGAREIYAIGLRNPWRFCFDGPTLLAADVGQNKIEMVHRVERGGNYGWRLKEGTFRFHPTGLIELPGPDLPPGLSDPVLQYDHNDGTSITGGYVYRGKALPALTGLYVFADYRTPEKTPTGRLFYGSIATGSIHEFKIGADDRPLGFLAKGFGQDASGELYVTGSTVPGPDGATGVVMKLVPAK
ncbi:MAG: PQQ-dependent sugar dehydrogenase [Chthoniobacteraceae bacterium]